MQSVYEVLPYAGGAAGAAAANWVWNQIKFWYQAWRVTMVVTGNPEKRQEFKDDCQELKDRQEHMKQKWGVG